MSAELLIFSHLQRTGGNSLRQLLAANFGGAATVRSAAMPLGTFIQRSMKGRIRAVECMVPYGAHAYLSPGGGYRYITVLREPLARWTSYYNFCLVHPSAGLHDLAKQCSLEEFLRHKKRPRNAAARILTGRDDCDVSQALDALANFSVVGVQERFVESTFLMCRVLGLAFPFIGHVGRLGGNSAQDQASPARLPADDAVDQELYAAAQRVLDASLDALSPSDRKALDQLQWVLRHAADEPELADLMEEVRDKGAAAERSISRLTDKTAKLPSRHKEWSAAIKAVLAHFAKTPPQPRLWLDHVAQVTQRKGTSSAAPAPTQRPEPARTADVVGLRGPVLDIPGRGRVTLDVESVGELPFKAVFLGHQLAQPGGHSEVLAGEGRRLWGSRDLGKSWSAVRLRECPGPIVRCFTTRDGTRLVQVGDDSRVYAFDPTGRLEAVGGPQRAGIHWHGSWSIDQANSGTICWAEYVGRAEAVSVHRSTDGGRTWQEVFQKDGREDAAGGVRHFHMVLADPYQDGRWYLSSGDRGEECRIWVSDDDGLSWNDIGAPNIGNADAHPIPGSPHKIYRTTAAVIGERWIHWCTDDLIDGQGPLFVRMEKTAPYAMEILGRVGTQHIRALIRHDSGDFIALSQGNPGSDRVTAHLLSETGVLAELIGLPKPRDKRTSFCRSVASRQTEDGTFFSGGGGGVLDPRPRLWKWCLRTS